MFNNEIETPRLHRTKYGEGYEANRTRESLGGFNYKTSPAYHLITSRWGDLKFPVLKAIAEQIYEQLADIYPIRLDRTSKRNKPAIYLWFQENFDITAPIINNMTLFDNLEDIISQIDNS